MDAIIALSGVLIGWFLGQLSEVLRTRREARDAATLVAAELESNLSKIIAMLEADSPRAAMELDDFAWRTYAPGVMRIVDGSVLNAVTEAYQATWYANRLAAAAEKERRLGRELNAAQQRSAKSADVVPGEEKGGISPRPGDQTMRALAATGPPIADALDCLRPVASLRGLDLLVLRVGRRRQKRRTSG